MAFNWRKFPWTNLHDLNLDWIIQTVKTLEENLSDALALVQTTVDAAITKLLTGSGDLTISKTGDVNITGKNVRITCDSGAQMIGGALMSASAEQLVMHNPNSKTSMSANYNNGVLTLTNNQQLANGVAVYPINTPADGGGDNSTFAANVGYVKGAVNAVDNKLDAEITNRTSGDTALQSTIDDVIMPRLNRLSASALNSYVLLVTGTESTESNITLTSGQVTALQAAAQNNSPITMILRDGDNYAAYYPIQVGNTSMLFGKVNNFNSADGGVDVNQALGRMVVAAVTITGNSGTVSFIEFPSGLTRFLPCSISITWAENTNSYTLTDAEYAILRQSLLDNRPISIVRNTADAGGEQTVYSLPTCETPSILNVDSMTLILHGASDSIKIQMADKLIVPNSVEPRATRVFYFADDTVNTTTQFMTAEDSAALKDALVNRTPVMLIAKTQGMQYCYLPVNCTPVPTSDNINDPNTEFSYTFQTADNVYRAMVSCSGSGTPSIAVFQTIT